MIYLETPSFKRRILAPDTALTANSIYVNDVSLVNKGSLDVYSVGALNQEFRFSRLAAAFFAVVKNVSGFGVETFYRISTLDELTVRFQFDWTLSMTALPTSTFDAFILTVDGVEFKRSKPVRKTTPVGTVTIAIPFNPTPAMLGKTVRIGLMPNSFLVGNNATLVIS